jgi:hypothetical protein
MLLDIAARLARAVDGVDWDAGVVDECCRELVRESRRATQGALASALEILIERIERGGLDDADGVAHVAISGGTLVERGAPPRRLGEVLLARMPAVLAAARRYADGCLAELAPADEEDVDTSEEDAITYVDGRAIPRELFRAHLADDRAGAAALVHLRQWTLPTVAALTRDRVLLGRATADAEFCRAARALEKSEAGWLHVLTGVELEASWMVLFPLLERGFRVVVDGVVSNFDLHALLADELVPRGIPGLRNPPDVIAVVRGQSNECRRNYVAGSWNLYTFRAAACDLREPRHVPHTHWVWGEGQPRDVPAVDGVKTLIAGPSALERSWNAGRTFAALRASADIREEMPREEVRETIARLASAE